MKRGKRIIKSLCPRGIFLEESSYIEQELSAEMDSSFMLDGNGDDHLLHIPSQMLMPPKVTVKYEKNQDAEEIASLTSDVWESRYS